MSSGDDVRTALEQRAASPEAQTIFQLIERQRPAIERALPAAIGAERFARIVATELRRNPALLECSAESLLGGLMLAAQLGLEPGPLGHVYLVPFKREATFIIGYRGYLDLARRSGQVKDVMAVRVCEGDLFEYEEGLRPRFRYADARPEERGELLCVAGLARFTNGGSYQRRLWPAEIEARRKRSPAGKREIGPWATDRPQMELKTVVRAMAPWLPMSALLAQAQEADEAPAPPLAPEPVAPPAALGGDGEQPTGDSD